MLNIIYKYELKRLFKQAATYIYFAAFYSIALLTMLGSGGFFDDVPETDMKPRLLNSPFEINSIFQYFNKFFLFLLPAIVGTVIFKDFKNNVHSLLYAYPIRKADYVFGKLFSALTTVFFISSSIGLAFLTGEALLGEGHPMISPTNICGYASTYIFFVFANLFIYGLIVFAVVTSLRNIYAGFVAVLLLFLFQIITENLFTGNPFLSALFDPFGQNAVAYETRYWTMDEQKVKLIPVLGVVLWNRLFWAIISLVLFAFFYKKFQLEQESFRVFPTIFKKWRKDAQPTAYLSNVSICGTDVNIDFSFRQQLRAMLSISVIDFKYIVKNWLFHVLVLFGILALVFALSKVTNRGDMTFLPLTRLMLSVPMFFFISIITLLTFIYAGMLVRRAEMARASQLIDTTATTNWVLMGSKILALLQVQVSLLFLMMVCGIGLQLFNGYYHFEIGLYLFHLFIMTFPILMIWAVISVFTHTIVPNVYLGIFFLLLAWVGKDQFSRFGIESQLFLFNSPPLLTYSDMNGFGNGLVANYLVNAYWLAFSGLMLVPAYLFWKRGFSYSVIDRIKIAVERFKGLVLYATLVCLLLFFFLGFKIYEEENSPFKTVGNDKHILENFRTNFGKYKAAVQPKITSVKLNIELLPERNSFLANGSYLLVNKSAQNIDTLLIKTGYDETTGYSLGAPSRLISKDEGMQFAVHVLEKPLLPNDSLLMYFDIKSKPNPVFHQHLTVLGNGTFLRTDILPRFGHFWDKGFIQPTDSLAKYLNFYSQDAALIDIETIISTSPGQTAIAPGYLQKKWTERDRTYFHYKTAEKIKFAFAFNSGIFSIHKTQHKGVNLEIYYHENHGYNLKDMLEGLKGAIDYNSQYFGPYQHAEIRIVEFPLTEGSFATVMSNSIPTSEVRFILKNEDLNNRVNLSFYVQAHEMTHQWWGNQVVPADAMGAKMLTESITEYISLRIYERYFGHKKAQHFLGLQRQRYLEGRTRESGQENPLYLVEPEQEYISYGKGAIALNTLQHFVGEDKLNGILKSYLDHYKFRTDHYPTTIDFISHLKKSTSPEFHYIIGDMMESITFYENKIRVVNELPSNQLEITIAVKKTDGRTGNELEAHDVFMEIGQYDENGRLIHISKSRVSSGENKITVSRKPKVKSIVIDPHLHFIELDLRNNRKEL